MDLKRIRVEGSPLPFRFNESQLTNALRELPIKITGTKDLKLHARMGLGKIVRIEPEMGVIKNTSLHNIRNPEIYSQYGIMCIDFEYHGISYEICSA